MKLSPPTLTNICQIPKICRRGSGQSTAVGAGTKIYSHGERAADGWRKLFISISARRTVASNLRYRLYQFSHLLQQSFAGYPTHAPNVPRTYRVWRTLGQPESPASKMFFHAGLLHTVRCDRNPDSRRPLRSERKSSSKKRHRLVTELTNKATT